MAKNSKRKRSERQKYHFGAYENEMREEKNRIRKLARHVKKFPLDFVASDKLEKFKKQGVPHRRKNRTVGIKLSDDMQRILNHKGKRLSSAKVRTLGVMNNPGMVTPAGSMNPDLLMNIMSKRTRIRYKTNMRIAMEKAQDELRASR